MCLIATTLFFILLVIIWAGVSYFSRLYGSKYRVYWNGYEKGYKDGVKAITQLLEMEERS